jgi:CheY-like chemotaxis protein
VSQAQERPHPLVLVVDDFEDNRVLYAEFLSYSGYEVEQATNGVQAIERAERLKPDVVVMDLSLPVMDGWEATRRLKADVRTRSIPVIALTGHTMGGPSEGTPELEYEAVLIKPCPPEKLVETVECALRHKPGPGHTSGHHAATPEQK